MFNNEIFVKTPRFDGPLALLLLLIQKQEMRIEELDISLITQQYLDFIEQMKQLNFDLAGDYLLMASTLLHLKSSACVSDEERLSDLAMDQDDPMAIRSKGELIRRLEELQRFQSLGQRLWTLPRLGVESFVRPSLDKKAIMNSLLKTMDSNSLISAMVDLIARTQRKYMVSKERISVKDKVAFFKKFFKVGDRYSLPEILASDESGREHPVENIVASFICLLELSRLRKVDLFQNESELLSEVYIEVVDGLEDFDINLAEYAGRAERAQVASDAQSMDAGLSTTLIQ